MRSASYESTSPSWAERPLDDGVVHLPVLKAARRFDVLSAVLDASEKVHEPDRRDRASSDARPGGRATRSPTRSFSQGMATRYKAGSPPIPPRSCSHGLHTRRQRRGHGAGRTAGRHRGLGRVASRMLSYMTSTGSGVRRWPSRRWPSCGHGATAADLERRFSEHGADLRPGVVEGLLTELESLGLIRVSRGSPVASTSSRVSDGD